MSDARQAAEADIVDLDRYADTDGATFVLTDAAGERHEIDVPYDIPFPLTLGLTRAYDGLMAAMGDATADEETVRIRYMRLCKVLSRIGALRGGTLSEEDYAGLIGQQRIVVLANVLVMRAQLAQTGLRFDRWLAELTKEAEAPKAPGAVSATSSPRSGASTDGSPITGGASAGASSGRRRARSAKPRTR